MTVTCLGKGKVNKNKGYEALPGRLANLLAWLAAKPFLTGQQLVAACRYIRVGSPMEALAFLQRQAMVSYVVGPGGLDTSLRRYYQITRQGIGALARYQETTARDVLKRYWLGPRRLALLVRALAHTEACHQFFVDLMTGCEKLQGPVVGPGLILWHGEAEAYCRYRMDVRDWALRPDAFGGYRSGDREVFFFLEWDSGNMAAERHRRKLLAYHHYRVWWDYHWEGTFPALLMVNSTQSRAVAMNHLVLELASAARRPPLPVYLTTHQALAQVGPLGARWWDVTLQQLSNPFNPNLETVKGVCSWR